MYNLINFPHFQADKMSFTLAINGILAIASFILTLRLIPGLKNMFIKANLSGLDMSKPIEGKKKMVGLPLHIIPSPRVYDLFRVLTTGCHSWHQPHAWDAVSNSLKSYFPGRTFKKPEAQGVICGAVFLIAMFLFIPVPFLCGLQDRESDVFPFHEYVKYLAALLSICCMIFLGFADDVLDLRWRHKLLLPTIASLPLLMVYFVTFNLTEIIIPQPLRGLLGYSVDIGIVYYMYMGMLAVFCTNAINILAGVNGLEAGQSFVIAITVATFNSLELQGEFREAHLFSLYFMIPFIAVSAALLYYNWYPSEVFVGDTFCYFAGMTFAVVAILGHFTKTMLLFMIPQVINFLYGVPQMLRFLPCPRHRLPQYITKTDKMHLSYAQFKTKHLGLLGRLCVFILKTLRLADIKEGTGEDQEHTAISNLTIINGVLYVFGPLNEGTLTTVLLLIQVICSLIALFIRYPLAKFLYEI